MWEQEERLTEYNQRWLLVLDQASRLFHVNIHPFRVKWKIQILDVDESRIHGLITQAWIAAVCWINSQNGTSRLCQRRDHTHVSTVSRQRSKTSPVSAENLARQLLSQSLQLIHVPGPLVEPIISPIPMTHIPRQ